MRGPPRPGGGTPRHLGVSAAAGRDFAAAVGPYAQTGAHRRSLSTGRVSASAVRGRCLSMVAASSPSQGGYSHGARASPTSVPPPPLPASTPGASSSSSPVPRRVVSAFGNRSASSLPSSVSPTASAPTLGQVHPQPPRPPSPAKRHAQQDLSQKLLAMDVALERIERDNVARTQATPARLGSSGFPLSAKGQIIPGRRTAPSSPSVPEGRLLPSSSAQLRRPASAGPGGRYGLGGGSASVDFECGGNLDTLSQSPHGSIAAEATVPTADVTEEPSAVSMEAATSSVVQSFCDNQLPADAAEGTTTIATSDSSDSREAAWREAYAALRAEVAREIAKLRDDLRDGEEERQRGAVRLLTDFEVELTSALEARAREADGLVEKRLIEVGEGLQRRLIDFEDATSRDRVRLANLEGNAQKRLAELETVVREDRLRVTETSQSCGEALKVAKEQLETFRQRLHVLQDASVDAKEQTAGLKSHVHQLQTDHEEAKSEVDRRLQYLEDNLAVEIREVETKINAQQLELSGHLQEMQRCLEQSQHALRGDLSGLHSTQREAKDALEERCEKVRRSCDMELATMRKGLEANLADRLDALRRQIEGHVEQAAHDTVLGEVDKQLARVDEDRCALAGKVESLAGRQERQQSLIEDLLASAARQGGGPASAAELVERIGVRLETLGQRLAALEDDAWAASSGTNGGGRRGPLQHASVIGADGSRACGSSNETGDAGVCSGACDNSSSAVAVAAATAAAAEELATNCRDRVELLAARLTVAEERSATSAGPSAEIWEAVRSWSTKFEQLGAKVDGGQAEVRAEFDAVECSRRALEEGLAEQAEISAVTEASVVKAAQEAAEALERSFVTERSVGASFSAEQRCGAVAGEQQPWAPAIRDLERELKVLLAEQAEDSANALRSMAALVQDEFRGSAALSASGLGGARVASSLHASRSGVRWPSPGGCEVAGVAVGTPTVLRKPLLAARICASPGESQLPPSPWRQ
eukprot:TRINITY_DN11153_c3_g1_i1.p1 TRINITY_DN11153_c3_g1~~TRINITY_DN11153_c3_g1_i1.p1  ORF type:complete len:991 (+),score=233.92 TRINITY_DN11153_c3_g1_i1:254-3226(+)